MFYTQEIVYLYKLYIVYKHDNISLKLVYTDILCTNMLKGLNNVKIRKSYAINHQNNSNDLLLLIYNDNI